VAGILSSKQKIKCLKYQANKNYKYKKLMDNERNITHAGVQNPKLCSNTLHCNALLLEVTSSAMHYFSPQLYPISH